ncbi:MAG: DNA polymerase I [Acidobacteriota bacterium]
MPPHQVADVLAIMGDSSDNIPGVKGIGEKGAKVLISKLGDLETALASADVIENDTEFGRTRKKMAKLLREQPDEARKARELVALREDVELSVTLDDLALKGPDEEASRKLFSRLGLVRLLGELGIEAPEEPELELADAAARKASYELVEDEGTLKDLCDRLRKAGGFALRAITSGGDPHRAELLGLAVSCEPGSGSYLPLGQVYGRRLSLELVKTELGPLLADPLVAKLGHDLKYDGNLLARHGMVLDGITADTYLASTLLDPDRRSHGLDSLAADHLEAKLLSRSEVAGAGDEELSLDRVAPEKVGPHAAESCDLAFQLDELLQPRLVEDGLEKVYREIELPLMPVLASMEEHGITLCVDVLAELGKEVDDGLTTLTAEIHEMAGREFSINSPKQLGEVLFDELGLETKGRTAKTGARSTSVDVLERLAADHPLPGKVIEHRELAKLKGTYLDALPKLVREDTGRIHTTYHQTHAATGRLSSTDPNLQNIPIRTELGRQIRKAFVAEDGWLLVGADYSQVELRVMASVAEEPALVEAFEKGEDIHATTAAKVFDLEPSEVTAEHRRRAKEVNFGVLYGMGAFGLGQRLGIPRKQAEEIIERYFARMPRVKETTERLIAEVREDERHRARTVFGRVRPLPEIVSRSFNRRAFAERAAVNAVVQGSAADLIKLAMIEVYRRLEREVPKARLLLQVHDELVLEAPEKDAEKARALLVECMEGIGGLDVPLEAVASVGPNWYELK